jgi:hypothetical protein
MITEELFELEQAGWRALSSDPSQAIAFYGTLLDDTVIMLLPAGLRLTDRTEILRTMAGPPWSRYELSDPHVLVLGRDAAVVTYTVTAQREPAAPYAALVSTSYVRRPQGWRLVVHQQTPIDVTP